MASILTTFSILKDHVKLRVSQDSASIDNIIFRLHYRATFLVLLAGCLLVCSRQYIGEHIRCVTDTAIPSHVIETFCFFMSTFTVVKHINATAVEDGLVPHAGIGPFGKDDPVIHHAYYQWVPFVLFFQAILFYMPHYLWKTIEGGRLKALVYGLHMTSVALSDKQLVSKNGVTVPSKSDRDAMIQQIRKSFINRIHVNRPWTYCLSFCELLNFLNVFVQIYLTNRFLGGSFLRLGLSVAEERPDDEANPLDVIFPKVTKCTFHKYGPSGSMQKHDALCVMALNIVNEKIYMFLWYWFIILAVVTALGLVWRVLTMILHSRSTSFNRIVFSMACPGKYNPWTVLKVTHEYYFSDWLFLYYIAKNLDNYVFKELFCKLAQDLEERKRARYRIYSEEEPLTKKE